jgi:hypothetical protein
MRTFQFVHLMQQQQPAAVASSAYSALCIDQQTADGRRRQQMLDELHGYRIRTLKTLISFVGGTLMLFESVRVKLVFTQLLIFTF